MHPADSPPDDASAAQPRHPKPAAGVLVARALRLRCPRCGRGPLFAGWFKMPERCTGCGLKFERAPGYFLGSSYINYGATAVMLIVAYPVLHYGFDLTNQQLAPWLSGLCVLFPLWAFRYARALWLALDCQFDASVYEE